MKTCRAPVLLLLLLMAGCLAAAQTADLSGPTDMGRCEEAAFTMAFTADPVQTASGILFTATLPNAGFFYVTGSGLITLDDGTPVPAEPTSSGLDLIWDLDSLLPAPYELPPGETATLEFALGTGCGTISGTLGARVDYEQEVVPGYVTDSQPVQILPGAILLYKEPSVIDAAVGDIVTWTLVVESTGFGPVYNVVVTDVLGSGLAYVSSTPSGTAAGQTVTWEIPEIPAGERVEIEFRAQVVACAGLANRLDARFGCADGSVCFDTALQGGTSNASIRLILKNPFLAWTPPSIEMPYCSPSGVPVTIPITNVGEGAAYNVRLCIDCAPLVVSDEGPGARYETGCFILEDPIPAGETYTLTFTVTYPGNWCTGVPSGTVLCETIYENVCGEEFRPPINAGSFSTTYGPDGPPRLSVALTGAGEVYICDVGSYNLEVSFAGLDSCGSGTTSDISVVVNVPAGFTVTDEGGGTWVPGGDGTGGTISWTTPPTTPLSALFTLDAPGRLQCGQVGTLSATAVATDCCGCVISASDSVPIAIQCYQLVTASRTATPATQEKCGEITYTNTYTFADSGPVIYFNDLTFIAYAENAQEYVDASLQITIDGALANPLTVINGTPGGSLEIQGIDNPNQVWGSTLVVSYRLRFTPGSLPTSCPSSHSFYTWTTLDLGSGCTAGDDCTQPCQVTETLVVTAATPSMSVSISGLPGTFVDPCGTYDVTVVLTKTSTYDPHNVRLRLGNLNYYIVDVGSIGCSGVCPASTGPTEYADYYEWEYDDAFVGQPNGAQSVLTFQVRKRCSPGRELAATALFTDSCLYSSCSVGASSTPSFMRQPLLYVYKTPEVIYATQNLVTWTIYVTNGGAGPAYEVWVDDVLGSGLEYVSSSADPDVTVEEGRDHWGALVNGVSWHIPVIPAGATRTLTVTARLESCVPADLTNSVQAGVGCGGEDCLVSPIRTAKVLIPTTQLTATSSTASPINTCATQTALIRIRNTGDPAVYNLVARETLPPGIEYVPDTTRWRKGNDPWETGGNPVISGDTLEWTETEAPGLAELRSRQTLEIEFEIRALCSFTGGDLEVQVDYVNVCGEPGSLPVGTFRLDARRPSLAVNKTQISPSGPVDCGGLITWRIDVTNTGQINIPYVWVEDDLGGAFTYESSTGGVYGVDDGCAVGSTVTWALENLPAGVTAQLTLTARHTSCDLLTNTVRAWWGCGADSDGSSCTSDDDCLTDVPSTRTITVSRRPTVSLTTAISPSPVGSCGETTFTLSIRNTSTATAHAVDARIQLPAGLSYILDSTEIDCGSGYAPADDPVESGGFLYWYGTGAPGTNLCDTIPPGETVRLQFRIQASCYTTAGSVVVRVYYRDCCLDDPRTANASRNVPVALPTLAIAKVPATVELDCHGASTVTWTITVTNTGQSAADWIRIEDTLGGRLDHVSSSPPATDLGGGTWAWELGPLDPGAHHAVEITAHLNRPPDDCAPALRTNTARATWGCGALGSGASCTSGIWTDPPATATVLLPDLRVTEADLATSCTSDGRLNVQARVRNVGDANAPGVVIRVYREEPGGWVLEGETVQSITAGSLYDLALTTDPLKCGVEHLFRVVVDEEDAICECNEGNNVAEVLSSCPCPGLVTQKTVTIIERAGSSIPTNSPVEPGDLITYTLTVRNVGLGWAFNVNLWDELPAEFLYTIASTSAVWPGGSSTSDPAGVPGPYLAWNVGATLPPDGTLSLAFRASVTSGVLQGASYTNTMGATGEEGDGTPIPPDSGLPGDDDPDDESSVTHPAAVPALALDKAISDVLRGGVSRGPAGPVEPGDVIVYTVTIRNVGYGVAYNVDFTDQLPHSVAYDTTLADGTYTVDDPSVSGSLGIPDGETGRVTAGISTTINPNGTLVATYRVRVLSTVSQGVDLVNLAVATGEDGAGTPIPEFNPDVPDGLPDEDSTQIGVVEPGLALEKEIIDVLRGGVSIWPTPIVLWGDVIVYRVTVRNVGLGTAYNVGLTDELPFGIAYDTTYGGGTYVVDDPPAAGSLGIPHGATGLITAPIAVQLNGGGTLVAVYRGLVTPEAIPGSYLTNLAVVTGVDGAGTPIPVLNPAVDDVFVDTGSATIRLGAPALVTHKAYYCEPCDPCAPEPVDCDPCPEEPIGVAVGTVVTFQLTVTNVGYSHAYDIVVEDRLPDGFAYVEESAVVAWPGGTLQFEPIGAPGPLLAWITGLALGPGESVTITFDTLVTAAVSVGEEVQNVMAASGVDSFNTPIPADSSMFVPADDDLDDMSTLRLIVRPPPPTGSPGEASNPPGRTAGWWATVGLVLLTGAVGARLGRARRPGAR